MTTTTDFRTFCYLPSDTVPVGGHASPRRPGPPATTGPLLVSTDSPVLGICCEWNHNRRPFATDFFLLPVSSFPPRPWRASVRPGHYSLTNVLFPGGPHLGCPPSSDGCSSRSAGHRYTLCCVHRVDEFCSVLGFMSMGGIAGFMVTLFSILRNW